MRILIVPLTLIALASAAGAATLSIVPDQLTYNIGETITLTIFGDDEGAVASDVFGKLDYSGALVDNGTRSQTHLGENWFPAPFLEETDDGIAASSTAFNQFHFFSGTTESLPGVLST